MAPSVPPSYQIDPTTERVVHLASAAPDIFPTHRGKPPHRATLYRLALDGKPDPDGVRVPLPTFRSIGGLYTSVEAIAWWHARINCRAGSAPIRTPAARRRAVEKTDRELDRLNVR